MDLSSPNGPFSALRADRFVSQTKGRLSARPTRTIFVPADLFYDKIRAYKELTQTVLIDWDHNNRSGHERFARGLFRSRGLFSPNKRT